MNMKSVFDPWEFYKSHPFNHEMQEIVYTFIYEKIHY